MCHVCKRFGDDVRLTECGGCTLIRYCGPEHRKHHWQEHKSLCIAVPDVLRTNHLDDRGAPSTQWADKKMTMMGLVETTLGRTLETYEKEMFLFPRECAVCQGMDQQWLQDCPNCAASYCKDHVDNIRHEDICARLGLCLRFELLYGKTDDLEVRYPQQVTCTSTFLDMKDFLNTYVDLPTDSGLSYDIVEAAHSQHLTRPLTLFHAMRLLEYVPKNKRLVIHVVGANMMEEITWPAWQILMALLDLTFLLVVMIGPELRSCTVLRNRCKLGQKECAYACYKQLYENYVRSQLFEKPDVIVGFNANIQQYELESPRETWAPSMRVLAEQNCPFILTGYTQLHLESDMERMNSILNRNIECPSSVKNLFASLKPHRSSWPDNVVYDNQYMILHRRSLCP
ncbi:PREDICTED: uncharacterized protein LOC105562331 [Vollenhovia emeryi]|uniref:uncharacterized protein LOC105562331 n=1 Tax=Vollenhovia emeryi TaxID=411798 RepID=UPI0005F4A9CA|nr:PREDICTED: uncharacterized protein LOC105562331 [Vollenhovia emeryi]